MVKKDKEVNRTDNSLEGQSYIGKTSNVEEETSSAARYYQHCSADEPLLDYEEYFQDDDSSIKREIIKKKKPKGKASYKITRPVYNGSSMADQISCQLAEIRASMSRRQPVDLRKEARENVENRRARKREEVLGRRRQRGDGEDGEWSQRGATRLIGVSDPFIYQLLWQFQRLRIVQEKLENWRLMEFRKRLAPCADLVGYCATPELKRRRQ